ncbi:MAG: DNA polymerase III subunit alpha, partial [Eubacteriales bacterium]|nr:DNA polymerase III subunit alpha [Eubacteriales bacterium]
DASQEAKDLYKRLDYELSTIKEMGYVEYFLIVWDFIAYARSKGIPVGPGRGSAAGSMVSYVLKITDIDPIKYGLIFERFLNPERISMPDIDIDFCYERRNEVIEYVIEKYGVDKVSQIITFGTMKAKAAVRDVSRALGLTYGEADSIAKAIPFDLKMTIDKALRMNPELRERYDNDKRVAKVIDLSRAIEGMPRHASTHAAGVVISKEGIGEYVPLYMSDKGISTQFTMNTIEELGLLKMDFLGLRTLTVIHDALELIEKNHGKKIEFSSMGYDDPKVYQTISEGNTLGIFQLESGGMTQFMKNLKPDCFEDIIAGIALFRPGPMASIPDYIENKKNTKSIKYINDSLKPILSVTYGCIVYQEQVMQIVRDLGGYSYGRSDLVRRAMSKKKADVMQKEKEYFIYGKKGDDGSIEVPGCIRNGIPKKDAEEIFNSMTSFAEYAFNKSHAAAYAVIAYETGYLKTYYPVEFMAALLTSIMGDSNQIAKYIKNCRDMGIKVLPPCVKEATSKFTVSDGAIRFGLLSVKNVGEGVINEILRLRNENGIPDNIFDFINNINIHEVNKKAIESLIKSGAFACMEGSRAQHLAVFETLIESAQGNARKNLEGQMSLFSMDQTADVMAAAEVGARLPDIAEFSDRELMDFEKEMLGVYISGHPLDDYVNVIERTATANSEDFIQGHENEGKLKDGMKVTIAGIISAKKTLVTKANRMMAFLDLQDLYGVVEILVFPNIYEKYNMFISDDRIIAVRGTVNFKEDEAPTLIAEKISDLTYLETVQDKSVEPLLKAKEDIPKATSIKLNADNVDYRALETILTSYPGDVPVIIYKEGKGFKAPEKLWVEPQDDFIKEISELIGIENIKI